MRRAASAGANSRTRTGAVALHYRRARRLDEGSCPLAVGVGPVVRESGLASAQTMTTIRTACSTEDFAIVRQLFREYQAELGIDLCFQGFAAEVEGLPGDYAPPSGRLLLALRDDVAVGCIALRAVDGARCEMKRLYLRPGARGSGLGRALVERLLSEARAVVYGEVVLDTLPSMAEAQRMYERFGFRDIPPYRTNPVAGARYLGLRLEP